MLKYKNTEQYLNGWGFDTVQRAKANLKVFGFNGAPKTRKIETKNGTLGKSLGYGVNQSGSMFTIEFLSSANYAAIVEQGRRPNNTPPPIAAIEQWIKDKPLRLQRTFVNKNGQKVSKFVAKTPESIRSAAYVIAKSIGKKGTKATRFFSLAMQKEFEKLPEPLSIAIVNDLADLIIDNFEKRKFNGNITKRNYI